MTDVMISRVKCNAGEVFVIKECINLFVEEHIKEL